jgi:hypothetical protein
VFKPINELLKSFEAYHKQAISRNDMYVESLFLTWVKRYDITHYYNGAATWRKLFSLRARWSPEDFVMFSDHVMLFKNKDGVLYFVSQSYNFIPEQHFEKLKHWADERDMNVEVLPDRSWHAPKMSILLQFTKK